MVFVNELVSSILLAIVQGITEWLPVSSSGHLVLFEKILCFEGSLVFDVALHFGTLMAVFVYFGGDIIDIIRDLLSGKFSTESGRIGLLVIAATIPSVVVGFLLRDIFDSIFRGLGITAMGFAVTGVFLIISSLSSSGFGPHVFSPARPPEKTLAKSSVSLSKKKGGFGYGKALLVGVAQAFALFPGVSRSGATIGSGLLLGLSEKSAMKFSFLMSIPVVFGANLLVIGNNALPPNLIWASLVSFVIGLIVIHLLYGKVLTKRKNLAWFGVYALALAAALGIWVLVM